MCLRVKAPEPRKKLLGEQGDHLAHMDWAILLVM
jgi:hypothetical protein